MLNIPAYSGFRERMKEAKVFNGTVTLKETQGRFLGAEASRTGRRLPQGLIL